MSDSAVQEILRRMQERARERSFARAQVLARLHREQPELGRLSAGIAAALREGRAGEARALSQRRDALLAQGLPALGLPADALQEHPDCPLCGDTGFDAQGALCACVRNQAARQRAACACMDAGARFECFDESLFPEDAPAGQTGLTLRAYMRRVEAALRRYAQECPANARRNLLLFGPVGTGKTFLLDCIARQCAQRGLAVVRTTGYALNETMRPFEPTPAKRDLFDCDLLLIDDLGAEPLQARITVPSLFNVLNERLLARRAYAVSTNLTPLELRDRYGERIASRLLDAASTQVVELFGADLRRRGRG